MRSRLVRVVAVADVRAHSRSRLAQIPQQILHASSSSTSLEVFDDWRSIVDVAGRFDAVVIALPDREHREAAAHFLSLGLHILLEKPMATTLLDCYHIVLKCREQQQQNKQTAQRSVNAVCHVLRYFAPCLKLKQLIDSGLVGQVVNINHTEPVGHWHFAHSFVRGNWHNEAASAPSLLAKCCHDIDLLVYWMRGAGNDTSGARRVKSVSSFGSLLHFRESNAPPGSTNNCFTCPAEPQCPYSAKQLYVDKSRGQSTGWTGSVVLQAELANNLDHQLSQSDIEDLLAKADEETRARLLEKCLRNEARTSYGRCVYRMGDNDVCDNQVVSMQFESGATATLTLVGSSRDVLVRQTRVYGTRGELTWNEALAPNQIVHDDFRSGQRTLIDYEPVLSSVFDFEVEENAESVSAHQTAGGISGWDYYLMHAFVEAVRTGEQSLVPTDLENALDSYVAVFAAEHARRTNTVVEIDRFRQQQHLHC